MDSYSMGDLIGELLGDDDMGDDITGDDVGARRRRVQRMARKHGLVAIPRDQAAQLARGAAVDKADRTGIPQTVGSKLATSGQRLELLPLGTVSLAIAAGSTAQLQVSVQRPIQPYRLILQAADSVTGADVLFSCGVSNVVLGAHNLFATPGTIAPATAFGRDAWGTEILSVPMMQGGQVVISISRTAAVAANASVVSAALFGYVAAT